MPSGRVSGGLLCSPGGFGRSLAGAQSIASAQNRRLAVERPPRPLPAREVKFPPYDIRTLANGMQVITVLHHEQPAVSDAPAGARRGAHDPDDKRGVARSRPRCSIRARRPERAADCRSDRLDRRRARHRLGRRLHLRQRHRDEGLLRRRDGPGGGRRPQPGVRAGGNRAAEGADPVDAAGELRRSGLPRVRGVRSAGLRLPSVRAAGQRHARDAGQHHARRSAAVPPPISSPTTWCSRSSATSRRRKRSAGAERVFGSWPRGEATPAQVADPPEPTRRIVIVDKPDAVQTEIRVGQLAIPRKHPTTWSWIWRSRCSAGRGNRLHRVLRSERGLTYGASADTEARKQAGDIVAETDTRTETTGEALRLMVDEFSRLQQQRVPERELSDAQAYLAGSFPLTIETPNDIATQVLNVVFYELPLEDIPDVPRAGQRRSRRTTSSACAAYLSSPIGCRSCWSAMRRRSCRSCESLGLTDVEVIPVEQLDLMSATLKRETGARVSFEPPDRSNRSKRSPTRGLRAHAGQSARRRRRAELPRRRTIARSWTCCARRRRARRPDGARRRSGRSSRRTITTFQMQQGTLPSTTRTYIVYPDKFGSTRTSTARRRCRSSTRARRGSRSRRGMTMPRRRWRADFAASVRRDIIPLLIDAAEGRLTVRKLRRSGRPRRPAGAGARDQRPQLDRVRLLHRSADADRRPGVLDAAAPAAIPASSAKRSSPTTGVERHPGSVRAQLLQNGSR